MANSKSVEVVQETPRQQFLAKLPNEIANAIIELSETDSGDASGRIAASVFDAKNVADVFAEQTLDKLEPGSVFTVHGFKLVGSDYTEGLWPYFAVVDAEVHNLRDGTSDRVLASLGGDTVLAQLLQAWTLGAYPVRVRLTERRTNRGTFVHRLVIEKEEESF